MILDDLPPIGFGAMPLSIKDRPDEATARSVLNAAMDEGMTFIDTADVYCLDDSEIGHNERLIASVVKERTDRHRIRIATKGGLRRPRGAWTNDGSPKHIREACEKSLRALEVEQIFLYQFHAPDPTVAFERSVETFAELQRAGKCRFVGISNVSVKQIDAASRIVEVASVQNRLNPFFREAIDDGVVTECEKRGIVFLAYSPLGGGRLSKKLPRIDVIAAIAKARGASPHAIVIAWVRSKGRSVIPIPGARTADHARHSARAVNVTLTAAEIDAIDAAEFSRA